MFFSEKLNKFSNIKHCFFSKNNGFSSGLYESLNCGIGSKDKVSNIDKVKPDFISTGNIGCITQISSGTNIPILHTVEVINWLTGGEKPASIKNI